MIDLTRISDADLVAHYTAENAIFEWCRSEMGRVLERVNAARTEIRNRGIDRLPVPPIPVLARPAQMQANGGNGR